MGPGRTGRASLGLSRPGHNLGLTLDHVGDRAPVSRVPARTKEADGESLDSSSSG